MNWDWIDLLPILAFVALAAGLAVVFRRTGSIVAQDARGRRASARRSATSPHGSMRRWAARPTGSTRSAITS